jgi:hypothetical protein
MLKWLSGDSSTFVKCHTTSGVRVPSSAVPKINIKGDIMIYSKENLTDTLVKNHFGKYFPKSVLPGEISTGDIFLSDVVTIQSANNRYILLIKCQNKVIGNTYKDILTDMFRDIENVEISNTFLEKVLPL